MISTNQSKALTDLDQWEWTSLVTQFRDVTRQWLHQVWFVSDCTRERSRRKLSWSRRYKGSRCRNWGQSWGAPDYWKLPGIFGIQDWRSAREKTWWREGQPGLCSRQTRSRWRSTPAPASSPPHSGGISVLLSARFASQEQVCVSEETRMKSIKEINWVKIKCHHISEIQFPSNIYIKYWISQEFYFTLEIHIISLWLLLRSINYLRGFLQFNNPFYYTVYRWSTIDIIEKSRKKKEKSRETPYLD